MIKGDVQIKSCIVDGALCSAIYNICLNDVLFAVLMDIIGAVVSFLFLML